jgi:tetratricopeptide (TPR) repeat protein
MKTSQRDPWHWYRLAQGLTIKKQSRAAAEAVTKAIQRDDSIGDFHALMARLMILAGQRLEALRAVQNALRRGCQKATGWEDAAICASLLGRHHDAATAFAHAIKRRPADPVLLCNAASNARHLGQLSQARRWLQQAVKIDPENARAWWMLAPLTDNKQAVLEELENRWQRCTEPVKRRYLAFALGHLHESLGNYPQAAQWVTTANRLMRKQQHHDQAQWMARRQSHFHQQKALWKQLPRDTANADQSGSVSGLDNPPQPLFILGLPRAGSSLLESLLAGHSAIQALGELPELPLVLARLRPADSPGHAEMGRQYLAQVKAIHQPGSPWFIDKLPDNAQHLGHILMALPQARIIRIDKQPMDAAWGLYKLLFGEGHKGWSYHLPWLGQTIAEHHRQCSYWEQQAPGRIISIRYEELVKAPEKTLEQVQQALGLEDETARMLAAQGQAATATASAIQVRDKISTKAIDRWKNYATDLQPARQAMQANGLDLC